MGAAETNQAIALARAFSGNQFLRYKITCADSVYSITEPQLRLHLQGGKAYIDAVQIIDNVEKEQKRQQAQEQLANGSGLQFGELRLSNTLCCFLHFVAPG